MDRDEWDRMWAGTHTLGDVKHSHGHKRPDELLVRHVGGSTPGRALDLGCGLGANAIWLAAQGWQVRAVDFSPVAIELAEARALEAGRAVEFVVADLISLAADREYDLVASFYVHLPVEERRQMLAMAGVALVPGGRLLFVGHDRSDEGWVTRHLARHSPTPAAEASTGSSTADGGRWPIEERAAALRAVLTDAREIAAELEGLEIDLATVVANRSHGDGPPSQTTLVVARRPLG